MQFEATKKPVYAIGAEGLKGSEPSPVRTLLSTSSQATRFTFRCAELSKPVRLPSVLTLQKKTRQFDQNVQ